MCNRKGLGMFTIVILCSILLPGCEMRSEDAKAYVTATLDASYKAKFEEYEKQTDSVEEEVIALYDQNVDSMIQSSGLDITGASEKIQKDYRKLYKAILKTANYKVESARKIEDGYEVSVKVRPLRSFQGLEDEYTKRLEQKTQKMKNIPRGNALDEMLLREMYEVMTEKVKDPEYDKARIRKVHIQKNQDGVYYIREKDLTELDAKMFPGRF